MVWVLGGGLCQGLDLWVMMVTQMNDGLDYCGGLDSDKGLNTVLEDWAPALRLGTWM